MVFPSAVIDVDVTLEEGALLRALASDVLGTARDAGLDPPSEGRVVDGSGLLSPRPLRSGGWSPPGFSALHRSLWVAWRAALWSGRSFEGAECAALAALVPLFRGSVPDWAYSQRGVLDPSQFVSPEAWARAEWVHVATGSALELCGLWSAGSAALLASAAPPRVVLAAGADPFPSGPSGGLLLRFGGVAQGTAVAACVPDLVARWVVTRRSASPAPPLRAFSLPAPAGASLSPAVLDTFVRLWEPVGDGLLTRPEAALEAALGVVTTP